MDKNRNKIQEADLLHLKEVRIILHILIGQNKNCIDPRQK